MTQIKEPALSCILVFSNVHFKGFNKAHSVSTEKGTIFSSDQQLRERGLEHQFCMSVVYFVSWALIKQLLIKIFFNKLSFSPEVNLKSDLVSFVLRFDLNLFYINFSSL